MIPRAHAILLAAGEGRRYGAGEEGKGLASVAGRPLLWWSLATFATHSRIERIVLVVPPGAVDRILRDVLDPARLGERVRLTDGGATRMESARRGIAMLEEETGSPPSDAVLIHDAARPLATAGLIGRCIDALEEGIMGVVPALPVRETLKRVDHRMLVTATIVREGLWSAQTPQAFRLAAWSGAREATCASGREFTDDASMLEAAGMTIRVVPGEVENVKVTVPEDRFFVERILRERGEDHGG